MTLADYKRVAAYYETLRPGMTDFLEYLFEQAKENPCARIFPDMAVGSVMKNFESDNRVKIQHLFGKSGKKLIRGYTVERLKACPEAHIVVSHKKRSRSKFS